MGKDKNLAQLDDAPEGVRMALGLPELEAMDAHAREHHGVSLGTLLASLIHRAHGIDLHLRTVALDKGHVDPATRQIVHDDTAMQIGPGAPRAA
jgi:hypothetical protein